MLALNFFLALLFLNILGFLTSLFVQVCVFLNISHPSQALINILNVGIVLLPSLRGIVNIKLRKDTGKNTSQKALFISCPRFLKVVAGAVVAYGVIMCIVYLSGYFSEAMTTKNMHITMSKFYKALSAIWIALYAFEFSLLYCYRKFWKTHIANNDLSNLYRDMDVKF